MGLCGGIKIVALGIFMADWWLVRRRRHLEAAPPLDHKDITGSIISLDKRKGRKLEINYRCDLSRD